MPDQGLRMQNDLTVWPMEDVRGLYAMRLDAARTALSRGDRPAAAESFRAAVDMARGEPGLQRELAPALVHLGKLEQELGRPAEAERYLTEGLALGERLFGAEHPSLAVVLNELSRLYIRQSNHARAKSVLERLLRITRAKGEEHPDVATALTGLAIVERGLGHDAAAEQLYRDALRIREKVLAPNHMAIVVTLEQLSETCAARGNRAEALALLKRALPTRETALGADHATVRALRARIAALEPAPIAPQPVAPEPPPRRPSNELVFIYEPEPPPRRVSQPRERVTTPAQSAPPARTSAPTSVPEMVIAASPRRSAEVLASVIAAAPSVALDRATQPDDVARPQTAPAWEPAVESFAAEVDERSPHRRSTLYLSAGLALSLAIATLVSRSSARAGSDDVAARADTEQRAVAIATTADGSTAIGARAGSASSAGTTSESLALMARAEARTPESAPAPTLPSLPAAPRRLAKLTVPVIAITNVDSLVRASTRAGRESDQMGMAGGLRASPIADDVSGTPPVLIGRAPLPYFPDALRSQLTEGEVVVRFRVDESGRVDESSMKVVKSDHRLFTLAVRSVLSRFRFEPARSPAPESKPRADWVDYRAEFKTKN